VDYLWLILVSTLSTYAAGLGIAQSRNDLLRRTIMTGNLVINLGLLFTFKYFNLLAETANVFLRGLHRGEPLSLLPVLLPVGNLVLYVSGDQFTRWMCITV